MSTEAENVACLKQAYQRWHDSKGGSVDHWLGLMTDDVSFRSLAEGAQPMQFTSLARSKQEVARYFAGLSSDWEMLFYRVEEYIAQGDRVVALCHISFKHKKTGKTLTTPKADILRFRQGQICEFFELYDTAAALATATP